MCSVVVLCLGAVSALTSMALVSIALNTDHWTITMVDRLKVVEHEMGDKMESRYFSRTRGIFRTCFPWPDRPDVDQTPGLYLSLVEDWCLTRNYHIYSWPGPANMTSQARVRLQLARATPALLVLYLVIMAVSGVLGLSGCWHQSANRLIATAAGQLLSALVGATAMATWHAALFFEMEKVHDPGYPLSWPPWLQSASSVYTGWSYLVAWAGVCLTLGSSLATSGAAICLRARARDWHQETLRMKLKMNSMLAGHTYYPGDISHASSPLPTDYQTQQWPPLLSKPNLQAEKETEKSAFIDYKKVVGELENSKF